MQNNQHTPESLRQSLRLAAEAAWQRDQIIAQVPDTAEQVRARQIFTIYQATPSTPSAAWQVAQI